MNVTALIVGLVVTTAVAAGLYAALPRGLRMILRRGGRGLSRASRSATRSARRVAVLVAPVGALVAYVVWPDPWWAPSACAGAAFLVAAAAAGRLSLVWSSPATVVALVAAATPAALPYAGELGIDLGELAPYARLAGPGAVLVAALAGATATAGAGILIGRGRGVSVHTVAAAFGVGPDKLQHPERGPALEVHTDKRTAKITAGPVPEAYRSRMSAAVVKLEGRHPSFTVAADLAVGVFTFTPTDEDALAARHMLAASAGLIAGVEELGDQPQRPRAARLTPPDGGWRHGDGEALAARALAITGRALVEFRPAEDQAVVADLPARDSRLRDRIAAVLRVGQAPWQVELAVRTAPDPAAPSGRRLDQVRLVRYPDLGLSAEKRAELWREIAWHVVPGGSPGWSVTEDHWGGTVTLMWGRRPELPARVSMAGLLPDRLAPEAWARLPLGVGPDGATVAIDLLAGPHSLVVGPTGSGKTVALLSLVAGALARGHELVVVDPTKAGLDFLSIRPWCTAWADTLESARAVLQAVYAEVGRRKAVLQREGEVKWSDLSPEVRAAERIGPLTLLVDEASSLFIPPDTKVVNALPKDDPEREALTAQAADKAMVKLLVGKLAREARFVGVHLQIGTQRPDAEILGGELRSNLTSVVQLTKPGAVPSSQALGMVFSAEQVPQAVDVLGVLDDGRSPGLAVVAAEGGTVQGLRVGYAPMREVAALLEERGVPHAVPLPVAAASAAPTPAPFTPQSDHAVVPQEVELGEMSLSWDDLAGLDLGGPPA